MKNKRRKRLNQTWIFVFMLQRHLYISFTSTSDVFPSYKYRSMTFFEYKKRSMPTDNRTLCTTNMVEYLINYNAKTKNTDRIIEKLIIYNKKILVDASRLRPRHKQHSDIYNLRFWVSWFMPRNIQETISRTAAAFFRNRQFGALQMKRYRLSLSWLITGLEFLLLFSLTSLAIGSLILR